MDDDPYVLRALGRLLRTRGLHSRTFESSKDFLRALSEGLPQCLILDLQMPEISGLQLQKHLSHMGIEIPTIVITADGDGQARERCARAGAAAFLKKPLQAESLFAAIHAASSVPR